MKGSTYPYNLPSGAKRWRAQLPPVRQGGKRKTKSGFKTKGAAETWLASQIAKAGGEGPEIASRFFGEYLEWWLENKVARIRSPKTTEGYRGIINRAKEHLGDTRLDRLTALALEDYYAILRKDGAAVKTIRNAHGCLHAALEAAVILKLVPLNPADACQLEPVERREAPSLDIDQTLAFMAAADHSWVGVLVRLAAATGARRGELLGLKWADLERNILVIRRSLVFVGKKFIEKTTKTNRWRRVALGPDILAVLEMHREQQQILKADFGEGYADLDLVFCKPDGSHMSPGSVSRACVRIGKAAGLSSSGLHILRHSHGSQLLSSGVPLPAVSKRLGHSDVHTTARVYAHALPSDEAAAGEVWEQRLRKGGKA